VVLARTMGTGVVALTMATMAEAEFAVLVPVAAIAAVNEAAVADGAVALAGATVAVLVSVAASGCVVISSISVFSG
jgi:hypothetical protein